MPSSEELKKGLPIFLENLITYLKSPRPHAACEKQIVAGAAHHGKELMRLNYTLSHVVHAYGAMCQAVTELAHLKNAVIQTQDFNDFNMCLDIAIAAAVSEFQFNCALATEEREVQNLGALVHELRNALSSATIAHEMIKQGIVANSGSTSRVLGDNLTRMRHLIDRSLSDVRMRADPEMYIEKFYLNDLVDQILLTATSEAATKKQILRNEIKSSIELETDRHLLLSAIANLVQNALKYSKEGATITLRSALIQESVIIEIEDECGGLQPAIQKTMFKPFLSGGFDQSGMGLGLMIVQKAITLLQGKISVRNIESHGCAILIEIPKKIEPVKINRAVNGESSAQPVK
ncbi:MAG: HAMP domain-containing sensor histidine kinase [Pseudobdellovibrio sp.]